MNLECKHISSRVSSLEATKDFYVGKLGLSVLVDTPHMLALRAGMLRISFHGGFDPVAADASERPGNSLIFATDDIERTTAELAGRGVEFVEEITEAPGFMKFRPAKDPDGNVVFIAQYLTDNV